MSSNKLKLFITKLQNVIICLTISILTYSVVIHLNGKNDVSEDRFPEPDDEFLQNDDEMFGGANTSAGEAEANVDALRRQVARLNRRPRVRNLREHGPVRAGTPRLVVLVHRARRPLRRLLATLARVAGVDDALLVLSHSALEPRVERIVRRVHFCMVLQLYYPLTVQLHPGAFPGDEPAPAPGGGVGPRRDARRAEHKHHWWWTAHQVFERLALPEPPAGMVVFLDEGSHVLPDLLHMLGAATHALRYFPDADVIALGRAPAPARAAPTDALVLEAWRPALATGLAFNGSAWRRVAELGWLYCEHDDTSWAHSLHAVFAQFPGGRALALETAEPRVVPGCRATPHEGLFPRRVHGVQLYGRRGRVLPAPDPPGAGAGGWSDHRDIFQCYEVTLTEENVTTEFPEPD